MRHLSVRLGILALVLLALPVVLAPSAGGAAKAKSPTSILITTKGNTVGFALNVGTGYDSGRVVGTQAVGRTGTRDGQQYIAIQFGWVLQGGKGVLTLRASGTVIPVGQARDIATGTWSVVKGTGVYAGATGRGHFAGIRSTSPKTFKVTTAYMDLRGFMTGVEGL